MSQISSLQFWVDRYEAVDKAIESEQWDEVDTMLAAIDCELRLQQNKISLSHWQAINTLHSETKTKLDEIRTSALDGLRKLRSTRSASAKYLTDR